MRAAVYARVSTEEQAQHGYSLAEQKDSCKQRAKELGATEILEFADEGISGATLDRPGLEGLRDSIKEGIIDLIVLRDPDRLSRKLAHQLILTEEFEKAGVRLEFLDFTWQDSPEGKLFYNLKGAVAEYEREKIKERMIRGKNQKARQGGIPMNFSLYGYDYSPEKGVQINAQEAEIVKQIFHKFVSYTSPHAIAIELTQSGVPTKRNTNFWHRQVVRQILMNPAYKGEWVYQKNSDSPIIIPVPAIVSKEVWETAQQILAESRRLWAKRGKQQYLLSGLITCTDCGTPMGGHYGTHWGNRVRNYTCRKSESTNRIPGCSPAKLINADSLELIVWNEVKNLLNDPDKLVSAVKRNLPTDEDSKKEIDNLKRQLSDTEKGMTQLIDLIASGIVELDSKIKQKLTQLKQRRELLERRIKEANKESGLALFSRQDMKNLKRLASEIIKNIDDLEFEEKQQLVRSMVSQVYISGRIQGTYHLPDDLPGVDVKIVLRAEMIYSLKNLAIS